MAIEVGVTVGTGGGVKVGGNGDGIGCDFCVGTSVDVGSAVGIDAVAVGATRVSSRAVAEASGARPLLLFTVLQAAKNRTNRSARDFPSFMRLRLLTMTS